jgi:deazaflavin-dependent oxidoreductase (nitroreductase family)
MTAISTNPGTSNLQELKERLSRYQQINLGVVGRKSGNVISRPVWFVFEANKLSLVPVEGSDTQWYKNILQNPTVHVSARGVEGKFQVTSITGKKEVASVVEKFREKYGASDVKKYYSKFDVAVVADLS